MQRQLDGLDCQQGAISLNDAHSDLGFDRYNFQKGP